MHAGKFILQKVSIFSSWKLILVRKKFPFKVLKDIWDISKPTYYKKKKETLWYFLNWLSKSWTNPFTKVSSKSAKLRATRVLVPYVYRTVSAPLPHVLCAIRAFIISVPRALRALLSRVSCALRVPVSHVSRALSTLMPYVFSCLTCHNCSCTSPVLYLAFSCATCTLYRTCCFAPPPSLASGVSSLTYSYASHVSYLSCLVTLVLLILEPLELFTAWAKVNHCNMSFSRKKRHYKRFS